MDVMLYRPDGQICATAPDTSKVGLEQMPIELFYSYSHRDEEFRQSLETHLRIMQRQGLISSWHDRRVSAGSDWEDQIDSHLKIAEIVILIVSADFIASDYCIDIELACALKRQQAGEAEVIPVIARPVDWSGTPFAKLQALPRGGEPISVWPNRDEAFKNVASGIREAVARRTRRQKPEQIDRPTITPKKRRLHFTLGKFIALAAMVATGVLVWWQFRDGFAIGQESVENLLDRGKVLYREKSFPAAYAVFTKAAGNGSGEAADYLGVMSEFGLAGAADCHVAMKWFQSGNRRNISSSANHMGLLFEHGCGTQVKYEEARRLFEKAANLGSVQALNNLGWMYANNLGVETDYKKAFDYFTRAANGYDPDAMNNIGWLYENGWGVAKPDFAEAIRWFKKAADANGTLGMNSLGWVYERGFGLAKPDISQAMYWFTKAATLSTGLGSSWAMNNIGDIYEKGYLGVADRQQATKWYQKSAENGFVLAQSNLERLGVKVITNKQCCP